MTAPIPITGRPDISILYCTRCNWLLRAAWMAQELLSTFGEELGSVSLIPASGGRFEITVNSQLVWERKRDGGFPGPKDLKQRVRDVIAPGRDMGHIDRDGGASG
ncbi:SelT/SelW/SelH family protein [Komagataeibacter xylinus]|uniref:SelT/SelW/SelH family protein n=1 Tax=Komagataeibacter xylinus TaxID=28448 RepID=UPI00280A6DCF|nr:SelT/SelW/SelH family protein [Komagataeibacter xylinus]